MAYYVLTDEDRRKGKIALQKKREQDRQAKEELMEQKRKWMADCYRDNLKVPEVAKALGVHRTTVNKMIERGDLPAWRFKWARSHWIVKRKDVEELLNKRTTQSSK